jgi:hypothetical protein
LHLFLSVEEWDRRIPETAARLRYLRKVTRKVAHTGNTRRHWEHLAFIAVAFTCLSPLAQPLKTPARVPVSTPTATQTPEKIFLVEHSPTADLYSNGLEVRNAYQTRSTPRRYVVYSAATLKPGETRATLAGLVFHTTESLLVPMESSQSASLNRTRDSLLEHVRNNRFYNFVIDRFGQVFRVVPEDQVAFHAGHSIWGDASSVFINLNESFAGIAFEARTGEEATAAQCHSGHLLSAMLRSAYGIADGNCVTHAQVSVNPENLRIGYHTDWAARFPFAEIGLSVGYKAPVAAVERFGFEFDESFLGAIGGHPWEGLVLAENQIIIDAAARGLTAIRYRRLLQQQYQAIRRLNHEPS